MPNTPQFQSVLLERVRALLSSDRYIPKSIVILVGDVPLKSQLGTAIAAEFGSRVQVEKTQLPSNSILVSGWQFWRQNLHQLPTPELLIVATLPFPSLENPLVAARVAYHKSKRQDWFRLYLLPTALREIQRAVVPLRKSAGLVAIFDNRVNHRSYGKLILNALQPCAKINYFDRNWWI